ncbi:GPO family capsid scaffolding protein [Providencia rettgeri]
MAEVISDWLCVCSAGKAADGRNIEKEWLINAANNYDRNKYTAMIWPYHDDNLDNRQFTVNYGMVDDLSYREEDGIGKLYAKLEPNHYLLELNKDGQKLFTSAEFLHDFAASGEPYFHGIVVTDIPASLYTDKLQFTAKNRQKQPIRGIPMSFSLQSKTEPSTPVQQVTLKRNSPADTANSPSVKQDKSNMTLDEFIASITSLLEQAKAAKDAADGTTTSNPDEAASEVASIAADIIEDVVEVQEMAEDLEANPDDVVLKSEFTYRKKELARTLFSFAEQLDNSPRYGRRHRRTQLSYRQSRRAMRAPVRSIPAAPQVTQQPAQGDATQLAAQMNLLTSQMGTVMEKFTLLDGARKTPVISGAPSSQNKTTIA